MYTKLLDTEDSVDDFQSIFALRYQVYCHDVEFLRPEDFPGELECDEFDPFSKLFIVKECEDSKESIGTLRLVRWTKHLSFPTARHFHMLSAHLKEFPLETTAEISRFCIAKKYRGKFAGVIMLELFKCVYLASKYQLGITHWIGSFEESLYRLLKRFGIHFNILMPGEIDYYGKVRVYGASLKHLEGEMKIYKPKLYENFVSSNHDMHKG